MKTLAPEKNRYSSDKESSPSNETGSIKPHAIAEKTRYFGKAFKSLPIPNLMETQRKFYAEFLQANIASDQRKNDGLEAVFRESFPIDSYDATMKMEYLGYELKPPRYSPDECRQLKQTYGAPLRIHVRLNRPRNPVDEWVYVGEMPLMIGGGEFIINGAERVVVTQIQRSPGVDFSSEIHSSGKILHSARIIPERGSWITVEVTAKDELIVRIDRSNKIAATMFLRALAAEETKDADGKVDKKILLDTDADVIRNFYKTDIVKLDAATIAELTRDPEKLAILVSEIHEYSEEKKEKVVQFATGIRIDEAVGKALLKTFQDKTDANGKPVKLEIEILRPENVRDELILNTLGQPDKRFDESRSHNEAILWLFKKLRPGNMVGLQKAWEAFHDRFFDETRYSFGEIGRFRINRKFGDNMDKLTFMVHDFNNVCHYILKLRSGEGEIDDIDHLENRRLRTIKDLLVTELRGALLKWKRSIREQMAIKREEEVMPHQLINVQSVTSAVEFFFARGELSQVVDQSNPLSQIVHERRLSALGPNGLNRKRAGFEVRDVHTSHHGRICPIETPEGANIGLIVSLATYAKANDMGFLITPYLLVKNKKIITEPTYAPDEDATVASVNQTTGEIALVLKSGKNHTVKLLLAHGKDGADPVCQQINVVAGQKIKAGDPLTLPFIYLRADQEKSHYIGQADIKVDAKGCIVPERPQCRHNEDFTTCEADELSLLDVAPKQMVGVSAALIPFLEHDDTSRALMGSNMQRQAVPLVMPDKPIVSTGMEEIVVRNTGMVVRAVEDGEVTYADCMEIRVKSKEIVEGERVYQLHKYKGLNDGTALNQQPIVRAGDMVKVDDPITDGAATRDGALALGINTLVSFISWEGSNFEDAIVVSERMLIRDAFTSVHIEEFSCEIRETKVGSEEITRDIPGVSEAALASLDQDGLAYIGTKVRPGDILVGKIAPKAKTEFSSEEKLLRAIFGRAGEDVKNDSLVVPPGTEGYVIKVKRFSRKRPSSEEARKEQKKNTEQMERETKDKISKEIRLKFERLKDLLGGYPVKKSTGKEIRVPRGLEYERLIELQDVAALGDLEFPATKKSKATAICIEHDRRIDFLRTRMDVEIGRMKRGDELKTGVLELVKVYIAVKRKLSVGDKMAGRHGNKGVVSRILPEEDMPFIEDGTPMEMILNPLGIPSRMNIGQVLETHFGWAASKLGVRVITPVFEGATENEVIDMLKEAGLPEDGKAVLYDGRTGEPFHGTVMVGYMYMLKLHHLVAEKIHARATGPYSLITQQPLGGKARNGGQRFGEMEVWAIEAYGAAHILQELLTVKSDDVDGRTKVYEAMVKNECSVEPGMPVSFDVLCNEIKGIGINLRMEKSSALAAPAGESN